MIPQGNRARFAGVLAAVAAVLALVALPGLASAHHGREAIADAGTIESFDQETGVLTIALTEGGTVSGLVTPRTHIHCDNGGHDGWSMGRRGRRHHLRHRLRHGRATASHDQGGEEEGEGGDRSESGDRHDESGSEDDHGEGAEQGEDDQESGDDDAPGHEGAPPAGGEGPSRGFDHAGGCTTEALTAGATVKFAVLTLVDGKAVYAVVGLPQPEGEEEGESEGES